MNLDDLLQAGKQRILDLIQAGKINVPESHIVFPQIAVSKSDEKLKAEPQAVYIEITAAESDRNPLTDKLETVDVVLNFIVTVWLTSGTARCHNIADRIASTFTVIAGPKCTITAPTGQILRVTRVRVNPPYNDTMTYRVNCQVDFTTSLP